MKILLYCENEARQKSHSLCPTCGNINTKFFHECANYRKNINFIWKISDDDGVEVEGFEDIAKVGINHFEKFFKEDNNLSLPDVMNISHNFPTSVTKEENDDLMTEVTLTGL